MKKLATLIFCTIFFFSCEEVIEIEVPSGEPKLIIDATFEVYFDDAPVTAKTIVKIRTSADYFDEEIPVVTNAIVTVENLSDNTIINFEDANLDGDYLPTTTFIPQDDIEYLLTVNYNNEVYKATTSKIKSPTFISVQQGNRTLFSGEETEVIVEFSDDVLQENFYLFDFGNNIYNTLEDRFFNGEDYNFSAFYQEDEIELPTNVIVKMSGISKDYYTYFRVLASQSGQSGGGPFQTIPSSLLGNIVNTTDSQNFPLGYFHISETDTFSLNLTE